MAKYIDKLKDLLFSKGDIANIKLFRETCRNATSEELAKELYRSLQRLNADDKDNTK